MISVLRLSNNREIQKYKSVYGQNSSLMLISIFKCSKTNFRKQSYLFVLKVYLVKSCISGSYNSPNVFIGLSSNSSNREDVSISRYWRETIHTRPRIYYFLDSNYIIIEPLSSMSIYCIALLLLACKCSTKNY